MAARQILAATAAASFAAGAAFFGYYDASLWGPMALVFLALALALVVGAARPMRRLELAAVLALVALWAWSLLSRGWSESADQALTEANRWALYAAILIALVVLVRGSERVGGVLIGVAAAGATALSAWILYQLTSGSGADLFLGNRLTDPIGYTNAEATAMMLGFWPLLAVAERARPLLAGPAAGAATAVAALTVLTQSRGALVTFALTAAMLVAVVPGRRHRLWALGIVILGLLPILGTLLDVYDPVAPSPGDLKHAARLVFLAAAAVALAWGLVRYAAERVETKGGAPAARLAQLSTAILVALALGAGVVGLVSAGRISGWGHDQYDAFVSVDVGQTGGTRLLTGGGTRYDYWRIAWHAWRDEPLHGVGAGNYDQRYFLNRSQSEDIRQPHSIEMQTLAELGIVGGLALLAFIAAVGFGLVRRTRRLRTPQAHLLTVAAGGMFLTWLLQTSVDWMHLIPGITGLALCAAAVLLGTPEEPPEDRPARPLAGSARIALAVLCGVVVAVAGLHVASATLSRHERYQAVAKLRSDPLGAIARTADALTLNDQSLPAWQARAAALARLGLYEPAKSALRRGLALEPSDWVTWGLLGDLELRRGDVAAARRAYRRGAALNPLETQFMLSASELAASARELARSRSG